MGTTLVMGASDRPGRYSNLAVKSLRAKGHNVIAFGKDRGSIDDLPIDNDWNTSWDVDTVTLYLNPRNQRDYYNMIVDLAPRRVIFNPGTENAELMQLLKENGIAYEQACTLVMLSIGQY